MKVQWVRSFAVTVLMVVSLSACEKQGPLERAGEEVDEAIDTVKNGGEESTATKADDAIDDLRKGANDAAAEVRKD